MLESLERILTPVHPGERRYMNTHGDSKGRDHFDGIPIGTTLTAIKGFAASRLAKVLGLNDTIAIEMSTPQGEVLEEVAENIPKVDFLGLPAEKRHAEILATTSELSQKGLQRVAHHLSPQRADDIMHAVRFAAHYDPKVHGIRPRNPFRSSDDMETAEVLALAADYKLSGVSHDLWISRLHDQHDLHAVVAPGVVHPDHDGGIIFDQSKLASLDSDDYRLMIKDAVGKLFLPQPPRTYTEFPIDEWTPASQFPYQ